MRSSTGREIRGGFFALSFITVFFYYLCQGDLAVENDISRYIESHLIKESEDRGNQFARRLWNENNHPIPFRSTLVGPIQRGLRANAPPNLQRLTSAITMGDEEQQQIWGEEQLSSSLRSPPGPIPVLEVTTSGVSKSQAIWNSGKILRAIRGYH